MLPLRYARGWRTASAMLLLAVLILTLMPAVWFWTDRAQLVSWLGAVDKWAHAVIFTLLAVWFAGQYRRSAYWRIAAGLFAFGVLIEVCQRMVGYRSAEWYDVLADAAGIILGLVVATAGIGGWSLRFEAWLDQRNG